MPIFRFCKIQASAFCLQTNSEERILGIASFLKMKMPRFRCCELPAIIIWFPTNSEIQFLGFASVKDHIDAQYSPL